MRPLKHPSRARLARWVDEEDEAVGEHVGRCERCADRLEELVAPTPPLGAALRDALKAPGDLQGRLNAGISARMQTRDDLEVLVELLGLPWRTVRLLSSPEPPQEAGS